ncbi:MAG: hypothetical protein ACRCY4_08160, partial [Brevinema sp.]
IGVEANAQAVYNFSEKLAVTFGVYIEIRGAPFAGDTFYVDFQSLLTYYVLISWGFSVGMLF